MQKLAGERISRNGYLRMHLPHTPGNSELPVPALWFQQGLPLLSPIYLGTGMGLLNRLSKSQHQYIRDNCSPFLRWFSTILPLIPTPLPPPKQNVRWMSRDWRGKLLIGVGPEKDWASSFIFSSEAFLQLYLMNILGNPETSLDRIALFLLASGKRKSSNFLLSFTWKCKKLYRNQKIWCF